MDSYEIGIDGQVSYLAVILNLKMAVLNVYNPAYLSIYLWQKHENWHKYTLWYIVSYET